MILLFLALTSLLLVCPSCGVGLTTSEFEKTFDIMCFSKEENKDTTRRLGQDHPLSQSLENFIGLLEKLEVNNPTVGIKDELLFFIRNYVYENIMFDNTGEVSVWKADGTTMEKIANLWEPEENERNRNQMITIPYSEGENCSIFNMLSHSIILRSRPTKIYRSATNSTRPYLSEDGNYPMEIGVVSFMGSEEAIALGKVLTGMYIGFNSQRKRDITTEKTDMSPEVIPENKMIDPLFTLTVAEVLSLAKWSAEYEKRENLATNGEWSSVSDTPGDICPILYKLPDGTQSSQSYSSLRGAADGLILGSIMKSVIQTKGEVKLSEVLRMYYSKGGISSKIDEDMANLGQPGQIWASFCNRENVLNLFNDAIKDQVYLYNILVGTGYKALQARVDKTMQYYDDQKTEAFSMRNSVLGTYCSAEITTEKVESLPLESHLDITAVLDTRNGADSFKKQQLVLGYFVKDLELSYYGSRMTILTDQKSPSPASATSGIVTLTPIVENVYSSPCAGCTVTQIVPEDKPQAPESEVIMAMDQLLQAKKDNETNYNGVKGKVLIYFNFKDETKTSVKDREEAKVDGALRDLNLHHRDVSIYALGRTQELVKRYTKNDIAFAIAAENPEDAGKELFQRVKKDAATFQYTDCEKATRESGAAYEDFVSRNAVQHWRMPAQYFYKSRIWKFMFEASFGSIRVCHYQGASTSPENQAANCKEGNKVEFQNSNPCKGLNKDYCSAFNFAIIGLNGTEDASNGVCKDTTTENKCRSMDQIKFRVTHEGIRCSGTVGLLTSPLLISLGIFFLHILLNRH